MDPEPINALTERPAPRRRVVSRAILLAVLAVAIALGVGRGHKSGPPLLPAKPAPAGEQFGANAGRLFNGRPYPLPAIAAQLKALRATGATLARGDAAWEATEPHPPTGNLHHYDWSFDDLIAGTFAASGLSWLATIDYSAPWARTIPSQDHSAPDPAEYAAYAAAVAARYGSRGSFWRANRQIPFRPVDTFEIWNEPDSAEFWVPRSDALTYARLYLRARAAIDSVDPGARVIVGGLTEPGTFLPAMLRSVPSLKGHIDGVAIHPYAATPQAVLAKLAQARRTLRSLGLADVPLYVTEFGWTTSPPGALDYLPERERPAYIKQTLTALGHTDCGVAAVLLYTWLTPEHNRANRQDWFGIHPPGGGATPDTLAFKQGLREATARGPVVSICNRG
jgi:hypothetical protein